MWLQYRCSFREFHSLRFQWSSASQTLPPPCQETSQRETLIWSRYSKRVFESWPCWSSRKMQQTCEASQPFHIPLKSSSIQSKLRVQTDTFHSSVHPSGETIICFCLLASPLASPSAMLQPLIAGVNYMAIRNTATYWSTINQILHVSRSSSKPTQRAARATQESQSVLNAECFQNDCLCLIVFFLIIKLACTSFIIISVVRLLCIF